MSPNSIMPLWQGLLTIGLVVLVTQLSRWLPFIAFGRRKVPDRIIYLGEVLPYAMMALLVVYCLRNLPLFESPYHGAPEIIAVALTGALHYWKGNMLVSIAVGTVSYMLLLQLVFTG